jgi:GDP-mannose 6-dehydrogenase
MNISIFGMGYVGCVSGACLAARGHRVIGVEPNPVKVNLINSGRSPIIEKGIDELINLTVASGLYRATSDWDSAIQNTEVALICVGTPSRPNGSLDLGYVSRVCEQIGTSLKAQSHWFTVVVRSTVLPGTVEDRLIPILERCSGKQAGEHFGVCMNPEFLREGTSIEDFHHPPKTVVGELNARSGEALVKMYQDIPGPVVRVPLKVAEMAKYADNTFHAIKVTFANEIGQICKSLGFDSHQVMEIFCLDTKLNLSPYYLKPGFAFGGSCLPKDLRALTYESRSLDLELPLLESVLESNQHQVHRVASKLLEFKGKRIGLLGLSFKGGTDDLRESPMVELVEFMLGKGFQVAIYDRHVSLAKLMGANREFIEKQIPHISSLLRPTVREVVDQSDVLVIGNRGEDFVPALAQARGKVIVDLVRICNSADLPGNAYQGIAW